MEFSLGLIEVQALGHAIFVLDAMTKAADVEFVATERKLGGRLVTLVVKGNVSAVTAAVEAGKQIAIEFNSLKAAEVIARPHKEILKFLHLDENGNIISDTAPKAEKALAKQEPKTEAKTAPKAAVKKEKKAEKNDSKAAKPASDKKSPTKKGAKK